MPTVNPLSGGSSSASAQDDGSAVWVDFAKSPVVATADPKHVTIVKPKKAQDGSAIWATK